MAESIAKDFRGKADWVYVGKSEAPKPLEKKADTLFNEYMQRVFDVARPVAEGEARDFVAGQGILARETANEIIPPQLRNETDKKTFAAKWLEWEKKASTPDQQNRLGKLLTGAVYMGGSFGVNFLTEAFAHKVFHGRERISLPGIHLEKKNGDMHMLSTGWEYLTDYGIEKASDWTAQRIANRENIGFVSPLSRLIGKIGNSILSVTRDFNNPTMREAVNKSLLNPGFIEGAFRFAGAVPGMGFIKDFYGKANAQIMKGEGIIPLGADLAFNMIFSRVVYQMQSGKAKK